MRSQDRQKSGSQQPITFYADARRSLCRDVCREAEWSIARLRRFARSADLKKLAVGIATSAAEYEVGVAGGASVVRAFNTIGAVNFGNTQFGPQRARGSYCRDDAPAKAVVR